MGLNGDVYIGLGSNIGDPVKNLKSAISAIAEISDFLVPSSVYVSSAADLQVSPIFLMRPAKLALL